METIMIKNSSSVRIIGVGLLAFSALGSAAFAQDLPSRDLPENGGRRDQVAQHHFQRRDRPQSPAPRRVPGTTSMDRGIEQQDTKIRSSICKGC